MRFKTEFRFDPILIKESKDAYKRDCELKLGQMISKTFGWQAKDETTSDGVIERHILEIEAFPIDKWVEFKKRLLFELTQTFINESKILYSLKELESFGKPAEAAKEINDGQ